MCRENPHDKILKNLSGVATTTPPPLALVRPRVKRRQNSLHGYLRLKSIVIRKFKL